MPANTAALVSVCCRCSSLNKSNAPVRPLFGMLKYGTLTIAAMLTTDDQKHFLITLQGPMLSRFRDPDLPAFQDVKLAPDADVVPGEVLAAYALTNPVVTPQFTASRARPRPGTCSGRRRPRTPRW